MMGISGTGGQDRGRGGKALKLALIILGLAAGILLLLFSNGWLPLAADKESADPADGDLYTYIGYIEEKAARLCDSVYGVSDVTVAVTLGSGFEHVYAADTQTRDGGKVTEYVTVGSGSSAHLTEVTVLMPEIAGIGVTCRGGEDAAVRGELTGLLSAAFGVGSNKIYISAAQ